MSHVRAAILKVLEEGELDSQTIVDRVAEATKSDSLSGRVADWTGWTRARVYPELRALADAGFIYRRESSEVYDSRGGRSKVYYALPPDWS